MGTLSRPVLMSQPLHLAFGPASDGSSAVQVLNMTLSGTTLSSFPKPNAGSLDHSVTP